VRGGDGGMVGGVGLGGWVKVGGWWGWWVWVVGLRLVVGGMVGGVVGPKPKKGKRISEVGV